MRELLSKLKEELFEGSTYDKNGMDNFNSLDKLITELDAKIIEVEKRFKCITKTVKDIKEQISGYPKRVDGNGNVNVSIDKLHLITRNTNDIIIATNLEDDEPIINNWYGIFKPKIETESTEDTIPMFFKIKSHVHKQLEGKTFKVLETSFNEVGHLIGALDCPHPEDETTSLWVNLDLDGEILEEPPTYQCNNQHTFDKVKEVIQILKTLDNGDCVDGETMDYIIKELGFEEYLLRSLVMKSSFKDTKDLLKEKIVIAQ